MKRRARTTLHYEYQTSPLDFIDEETIKKLKARIAQLPRPHRKPYYITQIVNTPEGPRLYRTRIE